MNTKTLNKKSSSKTTRPQWAKCLPADWWKHLQHGQCLTRPTLANLERDAETCRECEIILIRVRRVQRERRARLAKVDRIKNNPAGKVAK